MEQKVNGHEVPKTELLAPEETKALARVFPGDDETAEQLLARAEKQIKLHDGIVKLIAANVSPKSIQLFGDNIWLTNDACIRVLGWIGADISIDKPIKETLYTSTEGPYINFEAWGTVTLKNGRTIRAMGTRSTLDDFFAKENLYACPTCNEPTEFKNGGGFCPKCNKAVRGEKKECYKPLSEVYIPDVQKAAVTNMFNHALKNLGLMPTKEELESAGMNFEKVGGKVEFKKKDSPQQSSQKPPQTASQNTGAATGSSAPASQQKPAQAAASGVPKANIPASDAKKTVAQLAGDAAKKQRRTDRLLIGEGIVAAVFDDTTKPKNGKGGGTPFLRVVQNGYILNCFDNAEVPLPGGEVARVFDLIRKASGQRCEFTVDTVNKNGGPLHTIKGATRIGGYQWNSNGEPIGEQGSLDDEYHAADEDIPF